MTASIVIPCFDRWNLTEKCLDALYANTEDVEVILIDNGSGDQTMIEGPDRCEVYLRNRTNRGFARACNQGAAVASGDVVVFLNNDTEVHEGWLPPLVSALQMNDVAGPKLIYPTGETQSFGFTINFANLPGAEPEPRWPWNGGTCDAVTGACMAVEREKFAGFDEGYWNGYEDVDYCMGRRCCAVADSVVTHLESQSGPERWAKVSENVERLRRRWAS